MRICPDLGRIPIFSLQTLLVVVLLYKSLGAQGLPTASKEATISFFGTYSRVSTNRSSQKDNGFTVRFATPVISIALLPRRLRFAAKSPTVPLSARRQSAAAFASSIDLKISTHSLISLAVMERSRLLTPSPQFRGRAIITMIPPCTPQAPGSTTTSPPIGPHVSTTSSNIGIRGCTIPLLPRSSASESSIAFPSNLTRGSKRHSRNAIPECYA